MIAKRIFLVSFCLSFLVKIIFLVFQFSIMRAPSMGDDALTYQWKSRVLFSQEKFYNSDLFQNIKELTAKSSNENDWLENRFSMRAVGIFSIPYSIVMQALMATGASLQLSFFIMELLIALIFSIAIASFSLVLLNHYESSLVILLTAFTFDRFVPTNLALGLSFWCWMLCLKETKVGSKGISGNIFLASLLASLVHPVGKAFVFMGTPILIKRKRSIDVIPIIGGIILASLIEYKLHGETDFTVKGTAGLNISLSTLSWNLSGLSRLFIREAWYFATIATAICVFFGRSIKNRRIDSLELLLFGLFGFLLATLFHELPGYKLEAFSRIIPPLFIISVIYVVKLAFNISLKLPRPFILIALIGLFLFVGNSGIKSIQKLALRNIYGRPYFFSEAQLPPLINSLRTAKLPVIFAETDFSLFYVMIFNGYDLDIYPSNYLHSLKNFSIFDGSLEVFICAPHPRWLNPTSILSDKKIGEVFHGFYVDSRTELEFSYHGTQTLEVELNSKRSAQFNVILKRGHCESTKSYSLESLGRYRLDSLAGCSGDKTLVIFKTDDELKITAARLDSSSTTNWPWKSEFQVRYVRKGILFQEQFNFNHYVRKQHLPSLPENFQLTSVLPDQSGLICGKYIIK